jgi:hypothetical protein
METNATTLKLPAQREHWFLSEQSILAEAAERDIMPFLDGSYHPKPMYPEVRIVRYGYQKQLDGFGAPMTDAHGETIYRENANGEKIPELDAEGNHRIENEYMHQVGFGDLELQDVLKLHHEKERRDREDEKRRASAWHFLMQITEDHHRDLITQYMVTQNCADAWAAIQRYYIGTTVEDKRIQMDLAMKSIPKLLQFLKRTPTCEEVQHVVTAINLIVTKLAQLMPPTVVPDHEKKSLFLQSLPSICDESIQMIHTMNPNLTFLELTERWMASRQSLEFKKAASMNTSGQDADEEHHSMYSQDFAGRGGRHGRGRGREFGRGGRSRGDGGRYGSGGRGRDTGRGGRGRGRGDAFYGTCNYCNKFGHKAADCRKAKADNEAKEASQAKMTETMAQVVQQVIEQRGGFANATSSNDETEAVQIAKKAAAQFAAVMYPSEGASHTLRFMAAQVNPTQSTINFAGDIFTINTAFRHDRRRFMIDTGATIPVTPFIDAMTHLEHGSQTFTLGDGTAVTSTTTGRMGNIGGVWLLPTAPVTLIPMSVFHAFGYSVVFSPDEIILSPYDGRPIIVFADKVEGIMTVRVNNFHGVLFDGFVNQEFEDAPDLPPLVEDNEHDGQFVNGIGMIDDVPAWTMDD